jgi:hypothetical protein
MTTLPSISYLNSTRTEGEIKTSFFGPIIDVIKELLGGSASSELTISSGSITPTSATHSVDTESDASSDDLTNIETTNHPDGRFLLIRAENSARTVVVKHQAGGTGQISTTNDEDYSLDDTNKFILLKRNGSDWEEVFRSHNISNFAQTILDDTNASAVRATIDAQEETTATVALSSLSVLSDKIPMFNSSTTATTVDFHDEDDMASNDATGIPSQQSVKVYVSTKVTGYVDPRTNFVTPEMFGAEGDGTTDDKSAIQQALDDGRPVFFDGSKTYALGSYDSVTLDDQNSSTTLNKNVALDLNANQVIYGNGATLECDNASTDIMLAASGRKGQVKIYDLHIDCNNQADIGIYANDWPSAGGSSIWSPYWHLADVLINNFSKAGMILSTFVSQFDRCEVSGNTSSGSDYGIVIAAPGWYAGGEANPDAAIAGTSLTFNSCWAHNVNGSGWLFHEVSNSTMNACAADACDAAYQMRRPKGVTMNSCGAEKCSQWILVDPYADTLTINAGFWLHAGCTASSVSVSWLPSSAPSYWMQFTGNESGIVNISGFRIASKDNAPGTDHLRVAGSSLVVVSSQWRDAVSNNSTDWPTAAVFAGNTGAKDTNLSNGLP